MMKTVEAISFKEEVNEFIFHPNSQMIFVATDQGKLEILGYQNPFLDMLNFSDLDFLS